MTDRLTDATVPADFLRGCHGMADVFRRFHEVKRTGQLIIHFAQGQAVKVEIPGEPEVKRLDTGKKRAHSTR